MKPFTCFVFSLLLLQSAGYAQQKIEPGAMNYIYNPSPNSILYHDTLFKGSEQFKYLFYRQGDPELVRLYKKHQSNKIFGQLVGFIGTVGFVIGIRTVTSSGGDKGAGWALIGGGFATQVMGGYLVGMGQKNMRMAVTLFNQRERKASLGMGVERNRAGLVYQF